MIATACKIVKSTPLNQSLHQITRCFCTDSTKQKLTFVDDYEITGFIGKGSTSRVYQGYHIMSGTSVIIKLFKNNIEQHKILRQIKANQIICKSRDIVPLFDVVRDPGSGVYGLIFKNLHGVPLVELIGTFSFKTGLSYVRNILSALSYCHQRGVVHRDLKKSNILVTKQGAKLFDFGLAYIQGVHAFVTKRFGTKGYYTPQVMFKIPNFTRKIDVWVCGLIMAEILCNKKTLMPYSSDEQTARQIVEFSGFDSQIVLNWGLKNVKRLNFDKLLRDKCSDANQLQISEAAYAIQRMTQINPQKRPQAKQVLQFDIFKNHTV